MMQVNKRETLIIILAGTIMFVFLINSVIKFTYNALPHTIIHTIGIGLSIFLVTIAISAYRRTRSLRFLLLILGFVGFAVTEGMNLASYGLSIFTPELNLLNIEITHLFGVYALLLLAIATLRGV
ncbi:MAG: hypothetical protein QW416_05265 [Candidatus Nitrosocaldaceae archaeon]